MSFYFANATGVPHKVAAVHMQHDGSIKVSSNGWISESYVSKDSTDDSLQDSHGIDLGFGEIETNETLWLFVLGEGDRVLTGIEQADESEGKWETITSSRFRRASTGTAEYHDQQLRDEIFNNNWTRFAREDEKCHSLRLSPKIEALNGYLWLHEGKVKYVGKDGPGPFKFQAVLGDIRYGAPY